VLNALRHLRFGQIPLLIAVSINSAQRLAASKVWPCKVLHDQSRR